MFLDILMKILVPSINLKKEIWKTWSKFELCSIGTVRWRTWTVVLSELFFLGKEFGR
jgi:hypothetical protein